MKQTRHLYRGLLALAGVVVGLPAQAQMPDTRPISQAEVIKAWKAICYDNTFDTAAQIKVATSAPYGAVQSETDDDDTETLVGPTIVAFIKGGEKNRYCAVAAVLSETPDDASGIAYIQGLVGREPEMEGMRAFWVMDKKDHVFTIGFGSGMTRDEKPGMLIGSGVDIK